MPYETAKIYGPYLRPDGRQHIIAVYPDGSRKTTSYPKYLMEVHLGRYLLPTETVDHIDRDFTNNSISNLQVLSKETHSRLDAKRLASVVVKCQICGFDFTLEGNRLHNAYRSKARGNSGPYCSRSCAGKATHMIGLVNSLPEKVLYYADK